jgi:hypothetical protein
MNMVVIPEEDVAKLNELILVVQDMLDESDCRFDHHGFCQTHSWFDVDLRECPHARAKKLLAELKK